MPEPIRAERYAGNYCRTQSEWLLPVCDILSVNSIMNIDGMRENAADGGLSWEDTYMTQADMIREFALDHYIAPARAEGRIEITIRAGDVHQGISLSNAMPAVCGALDSNKFSELAQVSLRQRTGPANGANVYFRFVLRDQLIPKQQAVPSETRTSD